jgi:aarF domain-containing kinase
MQKLIVEEMVAAINALTREALCEAFKVVVASDAAVTALRNTEALGPFRAILAPIPQPLAFLSDVGSRVSLTSEDRHALDTVSLLLDMLGDDGSSTARRQARISSGSSRPSVSILEMIDDVHRTLTTGATQKVMPCPAWC